MKKGTIEPLVKGAAIREFLIWYGETQGVDSLRALARTLPNEVGEQLSLDRPALGIISSAWYPSPLVHAILDGVSHGRAASDRELLVTQACNVVVQRMLRGLYRYLFMSIASPALYSKHIQRMWRMLHNTGDRRIIVADDGRSADSLVESWAGHHPLMCFITVRTMVEVIAAMGMTHVHADTRACVSWGDERCHTVVRWQGS